MKRRLDAELVRRGLVLSRESARRLITSRQVLVDGSFAEKPARMVDGAQAIVFVNPPPPYVSRAGQKLAGALDELLLEPTGLVCLDVGSSTGGFTDCLLQRGAKSVVAVDVGTNQLHEKLRTDSRVDVREQTDARLLEPEHFDQAFDLIVGDVSFISLRLVLPSLVALLAESGQMVMLVKPQFEAGKSEASKGKGVISDPVVWRRTLFEVLTCALDSGLEVGALMPSSIQGTHGNVEFVTQLMNKKSTISAPGRKTGETGAGGRGGHAGKHNDARARPKNEFGPQQIVADLIDNVVDRVVTDLERRQQT